MDYGMKSLLMEEAKMVGRLHYYVRALVGHVTGEHPLGVGLQTVVTGAKRVLREVEGEYQSLDA